MTSKTKEKIIEAALRVFMRYGYAKTTMMDIAREAQVARQSLYNLFPNKAAILAETMYRFIDGTYAAIESALSDDLSFEEKLQLFAEHYLYEAYHIIDNTNDSDNLIDSGYPVAPEVQAYVNEKYIGLMLAFLKPFEEKMRDKNIDPQTFAETIFLSLQSIKNFAKDFEHLKQVTNLQIKCYNFYLAG